jgi:transcriptional regulator with XRE-family HTH domain
LALGADVSARHVSFLESGRARPSEEMVLRLLSALEVPLRDQNGILLDASFPARFAEPGLGAIHPSIWPSPGCCVSKNPSH